MADNKTGLGRLALLSAALIWGASFVVLKNTLDSVPTLWILAIRFTGAALLMLLLGVKELKKLDRDYLKYGAMLGVALFGAFVLQTFGLVYTTPAKNAFLTAAYCVIVPFLWWAFYKKSVDKYNISAALICLIGMALVSLKGRFEINVGDALTICCGFFYALHIVITAKAIEGRSVLLISMIQFAAAAVLCWIAAPFASPFPQSVPLSAGLSIAYLCVMCTFVTFTLQTFGQKYTPPQSAAIILTLESVFGTVFSMIFYHEQITGRIAAGFVFIFAAVIISEVKPKVFDIRNLFSISDKERVIK